MQFEAILSFQAQLLSDCVKEQRDKVYSSLKLKSAILICEKQCRERVLF